MSKHVFACRFCYWFYFYFEYLIGEKKCQKYCHQAGLKSVGENFRHFRPTFFSPIRYRPFKRDACSRKKEVSCRKNYFYAIGFTRMNERGLKQWAYIFLRNFLFTWGVYNCELTCFLNGQIMKNEIFYLD